MSVTHAHKIRKQLNKKNISHFLHLQLHLNGVKRNCMYILMSIQVTHGPQMDP